MTASWSTTVPGPRSGTGCGAAPRDAATRSATDCTRTETDGIRESACSSGSWCHRSTTRFSSSDTACGIGEPTPDGAIGRPPVSVAQAREEADELDVEPDD